MRTSRLAVLVGAAILCVTAAVLWAVWPRERLLLARATRVADATGWRADPCAYDWLSDHEVMYFQAAPGRVRIPHRLELSTGRDQEQVALGQQLFFEEGSWPSSDRFLSSSTLGSLLLTYRPSPTSRAGVAVLDGRTVRRWDLGHADVERLWWSPDGSSWTIVAVDVSKQPRVYFVQDCSISDSRAKPRRPVLLPFAPHMAVGVLGDGRLLVTYFKTASDPSGRADFAASTPGSGNAPSTFSVSIPRTVNGYTCVLSPRGDRLAWIMRETRVPAVSTFWQRVRALLSGGAHPRIGLWVSGVDGSGLREIGHIDQDPRQNRLPDVPRVVRWTPDEKRLSFLYHGALYTVTAD